MLEGALRMFPAWQWVFFGHTFAFNVFIPALLPLGAVFTLAAFWPFLEQWVTGDKREHHLNDRPRNAPTRTAIGIAVITFYGVLWAEGANDIIAENLNIPLFLTTQIAQVAWFVGPIVAYILTKRICLGLQRKDVHLLEHGVETGIVRQLPSGEFIEETSPVTEEARAVLESRPDYQGLPPTDLSAQGIPAPSMRGAVGKVRERLYSVVTESIPLPTGNGHNGHAIEGGHGEPGNGHGEPGNGHGEPEPAAVGTGEPEPAAVGTGEEPPAS
jgi:ubiquinol-cytochrome c reductase cytochrome b subunit